MPFLVAVSGFKNVGKTTLCRKLAEHLVAGGYRVGYMKHCDHEVRSPELSDTGILAALGIGTVLWGTDGIRFETDGAAPETLAGRFFPGSDIVLLEGGKDFPLPRIWVGTPESVPESVKGIFAFYRRDGLSEPERVYVSGEEGMLAACLGRMALAAHRSMEIFVGGKRLPMKDFIADFVRGGIEGMLGALKGGEDLSGGVLAVIPPRRSA